MARAVMRFLIEGRGDEVEVVVELEIVGGLYLAIFSMIFLGRALEVALGSGILVRVPCRGSVEEDWPARVFLNGSRATEAMVFTFRTDLGAR